MAYDDADFSPRDMQDSEQWTPEQFKRKAELLRQAGKHENADWYDKKAVEMATKLAANTPPPRAPDLTDQAVKSAFQRQMMATQVGQTRQSTFLTDLSGNKLPAAPLGPIAQSPMQTPTADPSPYTTGPFNSLKLKPTLYEPATTIKNPYGGYGRGKTLLGG